MEGLKNAAPSQSALAGAAPYEQKLLAERYVDDILIAIAEDQRQPDAWEAQHLLAAIGAIAGHMYRASASYSDLAIEPEASRARTLERTAAPPSLAGLRDGLERVRVLTARAA